MAGRIDEEKLCLAGGRLRGDIALMDRFPDDGFCCLHVRHRRFANCFARMGEKYLCMMSFIVCQLIVMRWFL